MNEADISNGAEMVNDDSMDKAVLAIQGLARSTTETLKQESGEQQPYQTGDFFTDLNAPFGD